MLRSRYTATKFHRYNSNRCILPAPQGMISKNFYRVSGGVIFITTSYLSMKGLVVGSHAAKNFFQYAGATISGSVSKLVKTPKSTSSSTSNMYDYDFETSLSMIGSVSKPVTNILSSVSESVSAPVTNIMTNMYDFVPDISISTCEIFGLLVGIPLSIFYTILTIGALKETYPFLKHNYSAFVEHTNEISDNACDIIKAGSLFSLINFLIFLWIACIIYVGILLWLGIFLILVDLMERYE